VVIRKFDAYAVAFSVEMGTALVKAESFGR